MILPGKTIGVLGGGEHARLLAQAAARLGYRVRLCAPDADCPAGQVVQTRVTAACDDTAALTAFARGCDVVTCESAGAPLGSLQAIEEVAPLRPPSSVFGTCRDRAGLMRWLQEQKFPQAPDAGLPIDLTGEITLVVARSERAAIRVFPAVENLRSDQGVEFAVVPARLAPEIRAAAEKLVRLVAEKLGLVGVMGVDLLVAGDGQLRVTDLTPGTHDSGHYTVDACMTSQFEQHVRAVCGLPLGAVELTAPAVVTVGLFGEAWARGEPAWDILLAQPNVRLHLYGKTEPRPGHRMGHFTVTARDADMALEFARKYRARLS